MLFGPVKVGKEVKQHEDRRQSPVHLAVYSLLLLVGDIVQVVDVRLREASRKGALQVLDRGPPVLLPHGNGVGGFGD